jgi:hypothetical protein
MREDGGRVDDVETGCWKRCGRKRQDEDELSLWNVSSVPANRLLVHVGAHEGLARARNRKVTAHSRAATAEVEPPRIDLSRVAMGLERRKQLVEAAAAGSKVLVS